MMRSLLYGLVFAFAASVIAWIVMPGATNIDNALGILEIVFVTSAVVGIAGHRIMLSRRST